MRLIFSAILAAALVFGGTLLFAHYFGSIEVRDEGAVSDDGTYGDDSQSSDDRVVEHCPSVDEFLDGSMPENYRVGSREWFRPDENGDWPNDYFVWPNETFVWRSLRLYEPFRPRGEYAFTGTLQCGYAEGEPSEGPWPKSFWITLAPGLAAEPQQPRLWNEQGGGGLHSPAYARCTGLLSNCGFYIVEDG